MDDKTLTFEWGECPVCKAPVTGTIEYRLSCERRRSLELPELKGSQSYGEAPACPNGHPLAYFAPRVEGLKAKDVEGLKAAFRAKWAEMLDTVAHVAPCVCGGEPVLGDEGHTLTCPDCGKHGEYMHTIVETVECWNGRMAGFRRAAAEERKRTSLYAMLGGKTETTPKPLDPGWVERDTDVLAVWDDMDGHHERRGLWPLRCAADAALFDPADIRHAHRWRLMDGTTITSMDDWREPEHGETSQTIRTLTGRPITIPYAAVAYVTD